TATRRLRSELRTFRPVIEPQWVEPLEAELRWLADLLGAVRDVDILAERIRKALAARGGAEAATLDPFFTELARRHDQALLALRDGLGSDRYRDLLTRLQPSSSPPGLRDEARLPCRDVLPPLAASAWRRLKKAAKALRPDDPDERFHEVRSAPS